MTSEAGWVETTWGEIAELRYGKALKGYREKTTGFRVYGTNGPVGYTQEPLASAPAVVVGRKGAYRGVHFATSDFWVIDTAFWLDPKLDLVDPRWAYYSLKATDINSLDSGSAIPSLSRPDFYAIRLSLPPLNEQRAIAEVVGALDDRIEWIESTKARLREATHAWFRLRYAGGNPIRLGDVTDTVPGRSYRSAELDDSSATGLVNLKNIPRHGGFDTEGVKGYIGPYKEAQEVVPGDVVIACTDMTQQADVIGRAGRVRPHGRYERLVASMDIATVRPTVDWLTKEFLLEVVSTDDWVRHVMRYVNGTTVLHLKKTAIAEYPAPIPDPETVADFTRFARPMWTLHDQLEAEAKELRAIREVLLPKLLSGELRIDDPSKFVEAVA